jgi:peptidoglycan hydrolase-like protein with peptidoglycan-binding domain
MSDPEITEIDLRQALKSWSISTGALHRFRLRRYHGQVLEMEDVQFHHDSAVMMPDPFCDDDGHENDAERITGLAVLRACYLHAEANPDRKILIAGHADSSGEASYNLGLSLSRARNVLHALLGERDAWVEIAEEKHKVEDYQQILGWLSRTYGWECDPGPIDNIRGPLTESAVREFQKRYNREFSGSLNDDGIVGPLTWGAFFDIYMKSLSGMLETDEPGLDRYRQALCFLDEGKRAVGCGEHWPIELSSVDEYRSKLNRRVEILFFEPSEIPPLRCHPTADSCKPRACWIYDPKKYTLQHLPCEPMLPPGQTTIILDDPFHALRTGVSVNLTYADGSKGTVESDDDGVITVSTQRGNYVDLAFEADGVEYAHRVFVRLRAIDTPRGVWERLVNLGYIPHEQPPPAPPNDGVLASALEAFQAEHGLEPTGESDEETKRLLREAHDTDTRAWEQRDWGEEPVTGHDEPAPKAVVS